jgi:hypothetical protein
MAEQLVKHQQISQSRQSMASCDWSDKANAARRAMEETSSLELKRLLEKLAKAYEAMSKPRS